MVGGYRPKMDYSFSISSKGAFICTIPQTVLEHTTVFAKFPCLLIRFIRIIDGIYTRLIKWIFRDNYLKCFSSELVGARALSLPLPIPPNL